MITKAVKNLLINLSVIVVMQQVPVTWASLVALSSKGVITLVNETCFAHRKQQEQ